MSVGREFLDKQVCATPGCTEKHDALVLHSKCHEYAPTWAYYYGGKLRIECAACGSEVVTVEVAP